MRVFGIAAIAAVLAAGFAFAGGDAPAGNTLDYQVIAGGYVNDGSPAENVSLHGVSGLARDAAGDLYISQTWGNRIRKVTAEVGAASTISTIVGGNVGFGGDGGPASAALINKPTGIVFDAAGNLYFADSGNGRIRRIDTDGIITTIAGNGTRVTTGDGGLAVDAGIVEPYDLVFDAAGNLYFSDWVGHRVRKIDTDGVISTVAGNGTRGDTGDGGLAVDAQLNSPEGLDFDADGSLYIADTSNSRIRRITPDGYIVNVVYATYPYDIKFGPDGALYFGQNGNDCQLAKYKDFVTTIVAGYPNGCGFIADGGPASNQRFGEVESILFDDQGSLLFADSLNGRVRRIANEGSGPNADSAIWTVAGGGSPIAENDFAVGAPTTYGTGISVAQDGKVVFADTYWNKKVRALKDGHLTTVVGNGIHGEMGCTDVDCDADAVSLWTPVGVTHMGNGDVVVSDSSWKILYRVDATGVAHRYAGYDTAGTVGNGDNGLASKAIIDPRGVAADELGMGVYVADYSNHRLRYINTYGEIWTVAGTGTSGYSGDNANSAFAQISFPTQVAVDAIGTVYFYEAGNRRIRKIRPTDGFISTFAGTGGSGFSGDGGQAVNAQITRVTGLAVDKTGLYIATEGKIRRVAPDGIITTLEGLTSYASGVAIRNGVLYVTSQDGRVSRASLLRFKVADHDFNGDGKSDVMWRNSSTGANVIWNAANGATQQAVIGVTTQAWTVVAQGDFDGDGKADLFWRNTSTGANTIWRSGNNATQIPTTAVTGQDWKVVAVGDFDADGKSDVVWRNAATGANAIWRAGNASTQIGVTAVVGAGWLIVGAGDFDGDGKSDILWRNTNTGANTIWRSAYSLTQIPVTGITTQAWKVAGLGDFDGDGKSDILWRNGTSGANTIWKAGNYANQQSMVAVTGTAWKVHGVGDFDGDGKSDVFWRNTSTGANTVWKAGNNATQQSTLGVTLTWRVVPQEGQP